MQAKELKYKEIISKLQLKVDQNTEAEKKHEKMKAELERLKRKYNEVIIDVNMSSCC